MRDVENKTAFISGGVSGLGLGIAEVLMSAGMNVVVTYMSEDHRDAALTHLGAYSSRVHAIRLDVSDRSAVEQSVQEAEHIFGPIQLLCNNAAVSMFRSIDEATVEDIDWILGVNLSGTLNLISAVLPQMKAGGQGGHIVNVSSMAAVLGSPAEYVDYAASKGAIDTLTIGRDQGVVGVDGEMLETFGALVRFAAAKANR